MPENIRKHARKRKEMQHFSQHIQAKIISFECGMVVPLRKCNAVTWFPLFSSGNKLPILARAPVTLEGPRSWWGQPYRAMGGAGWWGPLLKQVGLLAYNEILQSHL